MKTIAVIPARYKSTRFEGKVLARICDKPMIQHVWERVRQSKLCDDVLIACDDNRVMEEASKFGARCVMTSTDHASGTDRIAEAVKDVECDIVLNIQGDEPFIHPELIDQLAQCLTDDSHANMATVIKKITDDQELTNSNVVKVVIDQNHDALYFSRAAIPNVRKKEDKNQMSHYKHLGIYAYRKDFLLEYSQWPKSSLEEVEHLEQLRVLEQGRKIKCIVTDYDSIGVDTAEDLKRVEEMLSEQDP